MKTITENGFDREDAKARANAEVMLELKRYERRMKRHARAYIDEHAPTNDEFDGPTLGRKAAMSAVLETLGYRLELGQGVADPGDDDGAE